MSELTQAEVGEQLPEDAIYRLEGEATAYAAYDVASSETYQHPAIPMCPNPDCQSPVVQSWMLRTYQRKNKDYWAYLFFRCDQCGWEIEGPVEGTLREINKRWIS